jgi:hypothetical protein
MYVSSSLMLGTLQMALLLQVVIFNLPELPEGLEKAGEQAQEVRAQQQGNGQLSLIGGI